MLRTIGAVVVSYIALFIIVFVLFTCIYLALGASGAFRAGTYEVSPLWLVITIVVSLASAIAGGFIAAWIGKSKTAVYGLAGLVFVLGILSAIPALKDTTPPETRTADVGNMEAMMHAREPVWIALLNPVLGVVGVVIGGGLKKPSAAE